MQKTTVEPRKSNQPFAFRPAYLAGMSLLLVILVAVLANNKASAVHQPYWAYMALAFIFGAILGLTVLQVRVVAIDLTRRGIKKPPMVQLLSELPFLILLIVLLGVVTKLWLTRPGELDLIVGAYAGCFITWSMLPKYLWWRSLPE